MEFRTISSLISAGTLPPTSPEAITKALKLEAVAMGMKQVSIATEHVLHGGIYTRTIKIPAGVMITGALIKIQTTLTISGEADVVIGDGKTVRIDGFAVLPAEAGRKTIFLAITDTFVSMAFATQARSVEQAEQEFTDEVDKLKSRENPNVVVNTGEQ